MPSSREEIYRQFLDALLRGEVAKAQELIVPGFRADLGETLPNLSFAELLREIRRQRRAFPDLGETIEVADITEDDERNVLVITYRMTVTFSGTLVSADGRHSAPPTGGTIVIPSQDRVEFEGDKIRAIEVVTDMGFTMDQLFPSQ